MIQLLMCVLLQSCAPSASAASEPWSVEFTVSLGSGIQDSFVIDVRPDWAPLGAARFKELIEADFFTGNRFFRVMDQFVAQFGVSGDPKVNAEWSAKTIQDDPTDIAPNVKGTISFSTKVSTSSTRFGPMTGAEKLDTKRMHVLAHAKLIGE